MQLSKQQIENLKQWIDQHGIVCSSCKQKIDWWAKFVYGFNDYLAPNEAQIIKGNAPVMLHLTCKYCNGIMVLNGDDIKTAIPFPS